MMDKSPDKCDTNSPFSPQVIVQTISIRWSKNKRHVNEAQNRSKIPEIMQLPYLPKEDGEKALVWHSVESRDGGELNQCVRSYNKVTINFNQVTIEHISSSIHVNLGSRNVCKVNIGERLSLVYSYRDKEVEDSWTYNLYNRVFLDLAHGVKWKTNIFYTNPTQKIKHIRDLW
jgi:hypothetical protein